METPEWEVPTGEELATIYSDTYKLGLLALRLLAGDQHTKNPADLPPITPKTLRQLINDTLTKKPDQRPLPVAWTYLLGNVIDETQQIITDPVITPPAPAPAPRTYTPEPAPVVLSRQSPSPHSSATTVPTSAVAASVSLPLFQRLNPMAKFGLVAAAVLVLVVVFGIVGSNSSKSISSNKTSSLSSAATNTGTATMTGERSVTAPPPRVISDPLQELLSHISPDQNCDETYTYQNGALAEVHCHPYGPFPGNGTVSLAIYKLVDDPEKLEGFLKGNGGQQCPSTSQVNGFNWYQDQELQGAIRCNDAQFESWPAVTFTQDEFQIAGWIQGQYGAGAGPIFKWWSDRFAS